MATHGRIQLSSKVNNDTGFGNSTSIFGGRFINKDGSFNMEKEGLPFWERFSIFHTMLNMPRWKFIMIIIIFYLTVNLFFSVIYAFVGPPMNSRWNDRKDALVRAKFKEIYFFSTETFTTVGYGRVNPVGDAANFVASIEAISGFLSLAIFTGLMYGRVLKTQSIFDVQ